MKCTKLNSVPSGSLCRFASSHLPDNWSYNGFHILDAVCAVGK